MRMTSAIDTPRFDEPSVKWLALSGAAIALNLSFFSWFEILAYFTGGESLPFERPAAVWAGVVTPQIIADTGSEAAAGAPRFAPPPSLKTPSLKPPPRHGVSISVRRQSAERVAAARSAVAHTPAKYGRGGQDPPPTTENNGLVAASLCAPKSPRAAAGCIRLDAGLPPRSAPPIRPRDPWPAADPLLSGAAR